MGLGLLCALGLSIPSVLGKESFEQARRGKFTTLSTKYGLMSCRNGVAEIGGGGKSGEASLRMFGGQDAELKLDLKDTPSREVRLSAWAERWTGQAPFEFSIVAIGPNGEKKILEKEQPDVIVCTHPMCVKAIASYKEKTGLSTPLVTCITDISMHPEWKADQTDLYLAPTREIKEHLICEGTKAENILVTGIPVRQQFLNMDRKHLENEKEVRRVLVMGGGLGLMPDLRRLLGKLHSMQSVQTIVITGKNHKMYEEWVNRYEDVKVLGYTENISKYMRWADLVITKAGGITLFEILHSQVPLFVIHPFLEQEMNNARYAAEKGFAKVVWGKHEDYIPELEKLLNDRKLLKQMDENVRHARKEMIDVSLDKAVEIMEERMTA